MDEITSKTCSACGEDKPLEEYYRHIRGKCGRAQKCKVCESARCKEYYKENSEKVKSTVMEYRRGDPEREKKAQKASYQKNREYRIRRAREWSEKNRDKVRGYKRKYQAKLVGLKKEFDHNPDYSKVLERDGYFCYLCQGEVVQGDHQYDHIVPITKSGHHAEYNLSIAHSRCNISKQATLPEDLPEPQRTNALKKLAELNKGCQA